MPDAEGDLLGVIRFEIEGPVAVSDARAVLAALENAYDALFYVESFIEDARSISRRFGPEPPFFMWPPWWEERYGWRVKWPGRAEGIHFAVPVGLRLQLIAAEFHSPGSWDFIGKMNPLEVLRQMIQDHHERRKDREIREPAEKRRLDLENKLLEAKVVSEWVDILRKAGVPKTEIQRMLNGLIIEPLYEVSRHADAGLLERPKIIEQRKREGRKK